MDTDVMLTTVDNPWNPFTHYDEWYEYDEAAGHHSLSLLARVTVTSDELSEVDQDLAITRAIDEIVKENVSGLHKKAHPPKKPGAFTTEDHNGEIDAAA